MKWAKFLPISRNGQFRGLSVTSTMCRVSAGCLIISLVVLFFSHNSFSYKQCVINIYLVNVHSFEGDYPHACIM